MLYSKKVIKRFKNPKNIGEIKNPSGFGEAGNPLCGDFLKIYIKVAQKTQKGEYIKKISFQTLGCCAAIAASDVICDLVKNKSLEKALKINKDRVIKSLGELPLVKYHCSLLAIDALSEAIYNYLSKNNKPISNDLKRRHQRILKENQNIKKMNKLLSKK